MAAQMAIYQMNLTFMYFVTDYSKKLHVRTWMFPHEPEQALCEGVLNCEFLVVISQYLSQMFDILKCSCITASLNRSM